MIDPRQFEPTIRYGKYMTWVAIALGIGTKRATSGVIVKTVQTEQISFKGEVNTTSAQDELGNAIAMLASTSGFPSESIPKFPAIDVLIPPLSYSIVYLGKLNKGDKLYTLVLPAPLVEVAQNFENEFKKVITINEDIETAYVKFDAIDCTWDEYEEDKYRYTLTARVSIVELINAPKNTVTITHLNFRNYKWKIKSCNATVDILFGQGAGGYSKPITLPTTKKEIVATVTESSEYSPIGVMTMVNEDYYPYGNKAPEEANAYFGQTLMPVSVKKGDTATLRILNYSCNPSNPNSFTFDYLLYTNEIVPGKFPTPRPEGGERNIKPVAE